MAAAAITAAKKTTAAAAEANAAEANAEEERAAVDDKVLQWYQQTFSSELDLSSITAAQIAGNIEVKAYDSDDESLDAARGGAAGGGAAGGGEEHKPLPSDDEAKKKTRLASLLESGVNYWYTSAGTRWNPAELLTSHLEISYGDTRLESLYSKPEKHRITQTTKDTFKLIFDEMFQFIYKKYIEKHDEQLRAYIDEVVRIRETREVQGEVQGDAENIIYAENIIDKLSYRLYLDIVGHIFKAFEKVEDEYKYVDNDTIPNEFRMKEEMLDKEIIHTITERIIGWHLRDVGIVDFTAPDMYDIFDQKLKKYMGDDSPPPDSPPTNYDDWWKHAAEDLDDSDAEAVQHSGADSDDYRFFLGPENPLLSSHEWKIMQKKIHLYLKDNLYTQFQEQGITHSQYGMITLEQYKILFDRFVPEIVVELYKVKDEWSRYHNVKLFVCYINTYIWIALRLALTTWLEKHGNAVKNEKVIEKVIKPDHQMGVNQIVHRQHFNNQLIRMIKYKILKMARESEKARAEAAATEATLRADEDERRAATEATLRADKDDERRAARTTTASKELADIFRTRKPRTPLSSIKMFDDLFDDVLNSDTEEEEKEPLPHEKPFVKPDD